MKDERRHTMPFYERAREWLRDLLRNGRISTWTTDDQELDAATRPPKGPGDQAGESSGPIKPNREFVGVKFEGKF